MLKKLFSSKRFIIALMSILFLVAAAVGLNLTPDQKAAIAEMALATLEAVTTTGSSILEGTGL